MSKTNSKGAVKLQFSGHDTFPLRYGWLKKVFDAVYECEARGEDTKSVFSADDAIARFGVGKNMVTSMRYWALATGVLSEVRAHLGPCRTTKFGQRLLATDGLDPWLEDPSALWLLHWHLASTQERTTTWHWVFNHCAYVTFDREQIVENLTRLCADSNTRKVSAATLKRDVEVFIRTYVEKAGAGSKEDTLECPLTELALLRSTGRKGSYQLVRGPKATLNAAVFAFATTQFWQRSHAGVGTLSLESLFHESGSPGRVFVLDEESVVDLAVELEQTTHGKIAWSETAGLRQLICLDGVDSIDPLIFLDDAFVRGALRAA